MITKQQREAAVERAAVYLDWAGITLIDGDREKFEIADFGLSDLDNVGMELFTYVNTRRVCARELVLFPFQTCPEHTHKGKRGAAGKEETFRCRRGRVWLYAAGEEKELNPGQQYTVKPGTPHWIRADREGAVLSVFGTRANDANDIFTDPRIVRETVIKG